MDGRRAMVGRGGLERRRGCGEGLVGIAVTISRDLHDTAASGTRRRGGGGYGSRRGGGGGGGGCWLYRLDHRVHGKVSGRRHLVSASP